MIDEHQARRLETALAEDERTNELGLLVRATEDRIVVHGEVASAERRDTVLAVLRELVPDLPISDQLTVSAAALREPEGKETIR